MNKQEFLTYTKNKVEPIFHQKKIAKELDELLEDNEPRSFEYVIKVFYIECRHGEDDTKKFPKLEKLLSTGSTGLAKDFVILEHLKKHDHISIDVSYNGIKMLSTLYSKDDLSPESIKLGLNMTGNNMIVFLGSDDVYVTAVEGEDTKQKTAARSIIQSLVLHYPYKDSVYQMMKLAEELFGQCVNNALLLSDCPSIAELKEISENEDFEQYTLQDYL